MGDSGVECINGIAYGDRRGELDEVGHKDANDAEDDFAFVGREVTEQSFERSHIRSTKNSPRGFAASQLIYQPGFFIKMGIVAVAVDLLKRRLGMAWMQ